jgi:hypothetical protein
MLSIRAWATEAWAPLVDEIDAIIAELAASERAILAVLPSASRRPRSSTPIGSPETPMKRAETHTPSRSHRSA